MFVYGFKPYFEGQKPTDETQDSLPLFAWAKVWNVRRRAQRTTCARAPPQPCRSRRLHAARCPARSR